MPNKFIQHSAKTKMALTALGATGVFANPQIASADKVVVGSNLGNVGTTKFQDNTEVANQSAINTVNSELRNVQTDSHGVIQLNTSIKDLPESQIPQVRQSISRLGGLIRRYNQLKDQLNTQNNTNRMLNGQSGADNTTYINNPEDINAAANQLEQVLNSMQQDIDYNNRVVGENAQNTSQNRALQDKVIQSNQTITGAAGSLKHYHDGIWGNMDDVKRKSEDSIAQNGIVVDNTDTQRANTIQTNQTVKSDQTLVTTIDQANQETNRILENIRQQNAKNIQEGERARTYRGHAFYNIDDINNWLKEMQQTAQTANAQASTIGSGTQGAMDAYKAQATAKYRAMIEKEKKEKKPDQGFIKELEDAINTVNSDSVTTAEPIQVGGGTIEFGDIGQAQDVPNGAQDGTIAATKEQEKAKLTGTINSALQQVQDAANAASSAIQNAQQGGLEEIIEETTEKPGKPGKPGKKESGGSKTKATGPFTKEWLKKNIPMYSGSKQWNTMYRRQMDNAVNYTTQAGDKNAKNISSLAKKMNSDGYLTHIPDGTWASEAAAAIYQMNMKKTGNDWKSTGFGSVMFKNANIFDTISGVQATRAPILMQTTQPGDSEKLFSAFTNPRYSKYRVSEPAVKDWYYQYLHPTADGIHDKYNVGKYTYTVITKSPTLKFTLKNAYVYAKPDGKDAKGNIKWKTDRSDVGVTLEAKSVNGFNINDIIQARRGKPGNALYIYNIAINPYNGQLVVGTGYIATEGNYQGSGTGVSTGGGGGEYMQLGPANIKVEPVKSDNNLSVVSKAKATDLNNGQAAKIKDADFHFWNTYGNPLPAASSREIGLAQVIHVSVPDGGGGTAQYAPVWVSDIDDNQELVVSKGSVESGTQAHLATSGNMSASQHSHFGKDFNWKYTGNTNVGGVEYVKWPGGTPHSTATLGKAAKFGRNNAMIYSHNGKNRSGMANSWFVLHNKGTGSSNTYMSIDTSIFTPFGFITGSETPPKKTPPTPGKPEKETKKHIKVKPLNVQLKTMNVTPPKAHGYTKGTYNLSSAIEFLRTTEKPPEVPKNQSVAITLPTFKGLTPKDKIASSNDSIVIRRGGDTTKRTSSGNSLTVTSRVNDKKTSSGNSLVINSRTNNKKTSSGNSLVIHSNTETIRTSSGNSLTIRVATPIGKIAKQDGQAMVMPIYPTEIGQNPIIRHENGRTQVAMSVYTDPEIANTAKNALNDWSKALSENGVDLHVQYTTSPEKLKQGVTLAIMNSAANNEIISSYQDPNKPDTTMKDYAGLTTSVSNDILQGDGENDVFNASGTVTAGDTLKNTKFTIQLNTDGLKGNVFTGPLDKQKMMNGVLKHELGHVFGLSHDDSDSLMNVDITNKSFTGTISNIDAQMAAESIRRDFLHPADLFKK